MAGKVIFWTVAVVCAVAALQTAQQLRLASLMNGPVLINATREEVVYLRGQPAARLDGDRRWQYREGNEAVTTVRFDQAGKVISISCIGVDQGTLGCPNILGISLGATEDTLINRLGPPSQQNYVLGGKLMHYADLGITFSLHEYRVSAITKVQRSGKLDFLPRVVWNMLP